VPAEAVIELSVSDFVELLNQTFEYAYSQVTIVGELANFRVSKNRWVYFDLKDEFSTVKFFGTVYQLPGPLEEGMVLRVKGQPHLHNLYGFSVTIHAIQPAGEGSIKKAAELLQAKLAAEGLFAAERKRSLPYPPTKVGLVTSKQSAAYADFVKILNARWGGLEVELIDVQVQGDPAVGQIVAAIEQFNAHATPPEVIVLIRGGGSAEDLAAFSTEQVTRAVAGSRVPTLVAIGHEVDVSLAELAADRRASTPSNAAELLVPDRSSIRVQQYAQELERSISERIQYDQRQLAAKRDLLTALSPEAILRRGYAIIRHQHQVVRSLKQVPGGAIVEVQLADGRFTAEAKPEKV